MSRIRIASVAVATFILLPSCSLIIDTNPDGVITGVGGKGTSKGGKDGGGAPSDGGSATVGGTGAAAGGKTAGGTGGTGKTNSSGSGGSGDGGLGQSGTPGTSNGGFGGVVATSGGTGSSVGGSTGVGASGSNNVGGTTGSSGAIGMGGAGGIGNATAGGAVGVGGKATGGATTTLGGAVGVGGNATGGAVSVGGGATTGGAATGGVAPTGGMPATGGSSQVVCTGTENCSGLCVDLQTDKSNCGKCGTACESYQFCSGGTCLPHYVATKILPTSDLASDAAKQVMSAAVQTNKASGDLLVQIQLTKASVTLSGPADLLTTQVSSSSTAVALARYTATGSLVWGRDLVSALGSTTDQPINAALITPFVLAANGDPVLAYYRYDPPPTGPALRTGRYWMARINGNNANPTWATSYALGYDARTIIARTAKNDFISFAAPPDAIHGAGSIVRVVDNGTSATATLIGTDYASGALPGADGSTVWLWGCGYSGTFAINPWSAQTFDITANPSQVSGTDAFILGAQDTGQSTGPWMSEGDWGPLYVVGMDATGDLIVAARSSGYTTFNGGQDFLPQAGQVLVRINHTTGQIVWRTSISAAPAQILAVPGNRIVTLTQQLDPSTQMPIPTAPYQISIYSAADGSLLSSMSAGMMGQVVAAGTTDLFVLGVVSAAADFDPGATTDSQGSTPGVFISRYSF